MGVPQSKRGKDKGERNAVAISRKIDEEAKKEAKQEEEIVRMLFLGPGEAGKSTFLKQMVTLYGDGYSAVKRQQYIDGVHNNVIETMQLLCMNSTFLHSTLGMDTLVLPENTQTIIDVQGIDRNDQKVTHVLAGIFKLLWKDPAIQRTFALRSLYHLPDNAEYFRDRLDAIADPDYLPSLEDILRVRIRTSGIISTRFEVPGSGMSDAMHVFEVLDVGGQKSERKKWIHVFQGIKALLFVAAISEYDQKLFEDNVTNRMEETIRLWDEIANSPYFAESSMILFLNKSDLFSEKILNVPLTAWQTDNYTGPLKDEFASDQEYIDACKAYISATFEAQTTRNFFIHFTCATDTGNAHRILTVVQDKVLGQLLAKYGLV